MGKAHSRIIARLVRLSVYQFAYFLCLFFSFFSARLACRFIAAVRGARLSSFRTKYAAARASGFKLENTVFDTLHFTGEKKSQSPKRAQVFTYSEHIIVGIIIIQVNARTFTQSMRTIDGL